MIVGDIHGCLTEFVELLAQVRYDKNRMTIVLVGDLVNKGPYSAEVIKLARNLGAYAVVGNHDLAALKQLRKFSSNRNDALIEEKYNYIKQLDQ